MTNPGKLTYADLVATPEDGKRYEIIDGKLYVNGSPSTYHQQVSGRLLYQLYTKVELTGRGWVIQARIDVLLGVNDIVDPDLIVILQAHHAIIKEPNIQGVPDLIVEILSPSTRNVDRGEKRRLYERYGVPEYWLVDPDTHTVEQLVLEREGYGLARSCREAIELAVLPDVRVDLTQVW
jgi:Uma2 family endonuclease